MKQFQLVLALVCLQSLAWAQQSFMGINTETGNGAGSIFRTDANGENFERLFQFPIKNEGISPSTGLVKHSNGKYYGFTGAGGLYEEGLFYEYDYTTKSTRKIIDIIEETAMYLPIEANDGKLYGINSEGGANYEGSIYVYDPISDSFSNVFEFTNDTLLGAYPVKALLQGSDRLLYGITNEGGLNYSGTIFSFDIVTGTFRKLHDFAETNTGNGPDASLVQASNGVLYGTTTSGGNNNRGTIFTFDISSGTYNDIFHFGGGISRGGRDNNSLKIISNGFIYCFSSIGGVNGFGNVIKIDPNDNSVEVGQDLTMNIFGASAESLIPIGNKFYTISYNSGNDFTGSILEFDPVTDSLKLLFEFDDTIASGPIEMINEVKSGVVQGIARFSGKAVGETRLKQNGLLFEYDINTGNFKTVFEFNQAPLGRTPRRGLLTVSDTAYYGVTQNGGSTDNGVIYRYNPENRKTTLVNDFDDVNGSFPHGALVLASNGLIYGTARDGGSGDHGIIFSIDPTSDAFTKVLEFDGVSSGSRPRPLIQASNGKIYGTTAKGGIANRGALFEFDINSNSITKKLDFPVNTSGGEEPVALVEAPNGLLYGLTYLGGTMNHGTLFSYNPTDDSFINYFDFDNRNSTGLQPVDRMIVDGNTLYGMTRTGGATGLGVLFSFDLNTNSFQKLHDFTNGTGGFIEGVLTLSNEKLYGTASRGGSNGYGVVFEYDLGTSTYTKKHDFERVIGGRSNGKLIFYCQVPLVKNENEIYEICKGDRLEIIIGSTNTDTYVWRKDGQILNLSASDTLSISDISIEDSGVYSVALTNECGTRTFSYQVNVSEIQALVKATNITCYGKSDGKVMITNLTGGTPSYVFSINGEDFQMDSTFAELAIGDYGISVIDENGCTFDTTITITQPDSLQISGTITDSTDPFGNGSISIEITGGTPPYDLLWDNQATTANINDLVVDDYAVTITDSLNCTATATYSVGGVTSLNELIKKGISIYPNPAKGSLFISLDTHALNEKIQIFNLQGSLVKEVFLKAKNNQIDIQNLAAGLYVLQFGSGDKVQFIIE